MSSFLRPFSKENPYKLCFVCLGNICRSPTAEGVFIHKVKEAGLSSYFHIDSAGTAAYHIGKGADNRSQEIANKYGVHLPSRGRQLTYADLEEFDLILAMDSENFSNISHLDTRGIYSYKIKMIRYFDPTPEDGEVPDPYYGGAQGFENVFEMLDRSAEALLEQLQEHME
ncbi:MAG: low molecular weight protein-tyrosine-phosphatase [Balneolaceae bacterium]